MLAAIVIGDIEGWSDGTVGGIITLIFMAAVVVGTMAAPRERER